jgi:hypothetical protein
MLLLWRPVALREVRVQTNPQVRLEWLANDIAAGIFDGETTARFLRDLLDQVSEHAPLRDKIRNAVTWAEICATPRTPSRYGGYDRARQFLLEDVLGAARMASSLS